MSITSVLEEIEILRKNENYPKAFEVLTALRNNPDIVVQWTTAQLCWESCNRTGTTPNESVRCLIKLEEYLAMHPDCAYTHKSIAMLLAIESEAKLSRAGFQRMARLRKHIEKAIEYGASDGFPHYMLGMFCFEVANASLQCKRLAKVLCPSMAESTYEEALSHFESAATLMHGNSSGCYLMAAQCLFKLGKREEAAEKLRQCIEKESEVKPRFLLNSKFALTIAAVQNVRLRNRTKADLEADSSKQIN